MDRAMIRSDSDADTVAHRTIEVPVRGGALTVGIWGPDDPDAPTVVLIHGVTASHLAWTHTAAHLAGVRLVAPDLRGRGRSNGVDGPAGMAAHADDLAAVVAHLGVRPGIVVGHSMGAFVAVALAHRHPDLVTRLVLVDGGLPLATPAGLSAEELVAAILGPTAERLRMRFAGPEEYLDFWRPHPAFREVWDETLEAYFAYDLTPDGDAFRPATSYATTVEDTVDLNGGSTTVPDALAALRHPTSFVTVPRGLQDQVPGLYPPTHLEALLAAHPQIVHERWDGFNHYTVVMSDAGGRRMAERLRVELAR